MIQFVAKTIIDYINKELNQETPLTVSVDSDNAIVLETRLCVYYWQITVDTDINRFNLQTVRMNALYDIQHELNEKTDTIKLAIDKIVRILTITQSVNTYLKGESNGKDNSNLYPY